MNNNERKRTTKDMTYLIDEINVFYIIYRA